MHILSIDYGTSSCRASLMTDGGAIIDQSRRPVWLRFSGNGAVEIDIDEAWKTLMEVIGEILERSSGRTIDVLGISSMMGWVFLDKDFRTICPTVVWKDTKSSEAVKHIDKVFPEEIFRLKTGRRVSHELLAPHLYRLKENENTCFTRLRTVMSLKDELVRRFTGVVGMDDAHADYTGIYNVRNRRLDKQLCQFCGVSKDILPPIVPAFSGAGTIRRAAASTSGVPEGTPVIRGSIDGTTGMYGGGVLEPNTAVLVSGTTDVCMSYSEEWVLDPTNVLTVNNAMGKEGYLVGGSTGLAGGAAVHLMDLLVEDIESKEKEIAEVGVGAGGLIFSPGFSGERAPYWNSESRGTIIGLSEYHQCAHLYRALMEGTAFRLKRILLSMKNGGIQIGAVHQLGGGGRIDVWNSIRTHVLGLPLYRMKKLEATTLGTFLFCLSYLESPAILSQVSSTYNTPEKHYIPSLPVFEEYDRLFLLYEKTLEHTKALYNDLQRIQRMS